MTIRSLLIALPLLLAGWLSTLVVVSLMTDKAPASVVLFPTSHLLQNLPEDVSILQLNAMSITLTSKMPNLARRLYQSGALIVLPAGLAGCLPLPTNAALKSRAPA